jgi:8-oxo-dGTP diphosphatase
MEERPKIGVDVIVRKDNKILLLERKNNYGEWVWCLPGGHLEFAEEIVDCAKREVKEEANIDISNARIGTWLNNIFRDVGKHYITFYVEAESSYEPMLAEPEKFRSVEWFEVDSLPKNLFSPLINLVDTGYFRKV